MWKFMLFLSQNLAEIMRKLVLSRFWTTEIQTNLRKKKLYFFVVYQNKLAEKFLITKIKMPFLNASKQSAISKDFK